MRPLLARRHSELAEIQFEVVEDKEHGVFRVRVPRGLHGVKRETVIDFDHIDLPEFVGLRSTALELAANFVGPFELTEYLGLAFVSVALGITAPWLTVRSAVRL